MVRAKTPQVIGASGTHQPAQGALASHPGSEAYLEWEKKIEHIFECHNYSERKKVQIAALEFTHYAINWWNQLTVNRRRNGERPVSTWDEMKAIMRKRFIPTHYHRELLRKLQNLTQGSMSVEDYFKEMELAMIRANIEEDQETTIARFVSGLNPEIADTVELQYYVDLEEVVHLAIKVEKQLKRKGTSRNHFSTSKWSQNSKWGPNTSKTPYKAYQTPIKPSQTKGDVGISKSQQPLDMNRGKQTVTPSRNRDIQCFKCLGRGHIASQCPNRHTMVIRESGEIETDSEKEEEDDTIRRNYKDEVLCDVVPMHATHMLLGRPWQFDRKVMHDGYRNRYSFTYDGKKHTLAPLSPQQVHDGQVHLKKSFEEFKEKEQKTVKIEIEQKNERENEVKAKRKGNGMSEIVSRGENRKMSVFARGTFFGQSSTPPPQPSASAAATAQPSTHTSAKEGVTEEVHFSSDDENDIFDWQSQRDHLLTLGPVTTTPAPAAPILYAAPTPTTSAAVERPTPDSPARKRGKATAGRTFGREMPSSPEEEEADQRPAKKRKYHIITTDSDDDDSSAEVPVPKPLQSADPSLSPSI
ncbi:hypothetical protein GQ457_14G015160 [Hibiscus cannabinus]